MGYIPLYTFSDYPEVTTISGAMNISSGEEAIKQILDAYQIILLLERELLDLSDNTNDEGTNALMSNYIREQEKSVWSIPHTKIKIQPYHIPIKIFKYGFKIC